MCMHHNKISDRKAEHVEICLNEKTQAERNYWEDLKFIHHAIPELDLDSISTKTEILGMELTTPIIISAMTGGFKGAREINENLARAAAEFGIGFGIGSERAMLDDPDPEVIDSFKIVKAYKPRIKISNIGAAQLVEQKGAKPLGMDEIRYLIEIIDANALAIHLNYLQECMQLTETNSKGLLKVIEKIVEELDVPVIIKETGAGISFEVAEALGQIGVKCIDVGGLGGTSFAGVEYHRAKNQRLKRISKDFWNWGIPTPVSIAMCRDMDMEIIGTGGIRSGIDVAKALKIGADCAGIAKPFLKPALSSYNSVIEELEIFNLELKMTMLLLGAADISGLRDADMLLTSELRDWLYTSEI